MQVKTLFSPGTGSPYQQCRFTSVDEVELDVGETLPLQGFPEERLYYFTDGRGFLDIYPDDQYEIRQNTALWTTPMIPTEIRNTGPRPLYFTVFRVGNVPLPEVRDGMLTWTAVGNSGHAAPGSGQSTVYVYETPRHEEGLHLRIHLIGLRRSQRTHDPAEVLTLLPGTATQRHTHPDIEETIYVLTGSGVALWDDDEVAIAPGSALCYPRDVVRLVRNTGDTPLVYVCHSASLD
jgi:mannose-6-phosphate isomerase-like protein (cupin superfamily)